MYRKQMTTVTVISPTSVTLTMGGDILVLEEQQAYNVLR